MTGRNGREILKEPQVIIAMTERFRVEGTIHLLPESRLSDLLNRPDFDFLAVTDCRIFTLAGELIYETPFISLNKEHIVFAAPVGNRGDLTAADD